MKMNSCIGKENLIFTFLIAPTKKYNSFCPNNYLYILKNKYLMIMEIQNNRMIYQKFLNSKAYGNMAMIQKPKYI